MPRNLGWILLTLVALAIGYTLWSLLASGRSPIVEDAESHPVSANPRPAAEPLKGPSSDSSLQREIVEHEPIDPSNRADSDDSDEPDEPDKTQTTPYTIHVQAIDAKGWPVPAAKITAGRMRGDSVDHSRPLKTATTDDVGRHSLELHNEPVWLEAAHPDAGNSDPKEVRSHLADREVLLTLIEPVKLQGVVLAGDGQPISKQLVNLDRLDGLSDEDASARTDAEGRFRFNVRPRTTYDINAKNGSETVHVYCTPAVDEAAQVVVRFPGQFRLRGTLLDPEGTPVSGGTVRFWQMLKTPPRIGEAAAELGSAKTDKHGAFECNLSHASAYRFIARAPGHMHSDMLELVFPGPDSPVTLWLSPAAEISGAVRTLDGQPVANAILKLRPEKGAASHRHDQPRAHDRFGAVENSVSDALGRFLFPEVHPGTTYELIVQPIAESPMREVRRSGVAAGIRGLEVVLTAAEIAGARIDGQVFDLDDKPVELFEVFRTHGGKTSRFANGSKGRFKLEDLALGQQYDLIIRAEHFANQRLQPIIATEKPASVVVKLGSEGSILARVVDLRGESIHGALVVLLPQSFSLTRGGFMPQHTNAAGEARWPNVQPQQYRTIVFRDGSFQGEQSILVRPGNQTRVELQARR